MTGLSRELFIGLMSGTSADGVDCSLVDFGQSRPKNIANHYISFDPMLQKQILKISSIDLISIHQLATLGITITQLYALAVKETLQKAKLTHADVRAIGCHGQTIRHQPNSGYTCQVVNGSLLAELTQITTVVDFRGRDIAAGGEGAPLTPAFHEAMFRSNDSHRVVINIGGMANVTDLPPNKPGNGFDIGPGNHLLDRWTQLHLGQSFDKNGDWAKSGSVHTELLNRLKQHEFLNQPPPKSCSNAQFSLDWVKTLLPKNIYPKDVQATLLEFTAQTILDAQQRFCTRAQQIYICGGGAKNKFLIQRLNEIINTAELRTTDEIGFGVDWVEACAFAWLAKKAFRKEPIDLTRTTGSKGPRILGSVYSA